MSTKQRQRVDRAVVFEEEGQECHIFELGDDSFDREKGIIKVPGFVLPIGDAAVRISEKGRVYFYNCPAAYLEETKHLAQVEQQIIIEKALIYPNHRQPEVEGGSKKAVFLVLGIVLLLIISVASCMGGGSA